jgi:addiction module HigA family antidote
MARNSNRCPTHPGELLREEVIPAIHRSKTEIAGLLGISRQHLYDILGERKPVTPEVRVRLGRLGKLFGNGTGFGCGCRLLTTFGRLNVKLMCQKFRRCRAPLEAA